MNILVGKNGTQMGPFSADQVRSMLQSGMLAGTDLAWHEGRPDWIPLWQLFGMAQPLSHGTADMSQSSNSTNTALSPVIIGGYACAAISLLFFPVIFGPLGLAFGIIALMRKQYASGIVIIVLSCAMAYFGFIIGASMAASRM